MITNVRGELENNVPQKDINMANDLSNIDSDNFLNENKFTVVTKEQAEELKRSIDSISDEVKAEFECNIKNISLDKRFLQFDENFGSGSFKNVFKGYDRLKKRYVAWCENSKLKLTKADMKKVKEEVNILKKLNHKNIIRFLAFWEYEYDKHEQPEFVLITELMDSGTLKSYLMKNPTINHSLIRNWSTQILEGLKYLHSFKPVIIHRDLKCDNILIDVESGCVKIGDLGLATIKKKEPVRSVIGTPEFMAPEMYDENYDEGVDIYAFGMCLLEIVTGEYPYQECGSPPQVFKKVCNGTKPLALNKIKKKYSSVKAIIERCLRRNRNERWTIDEILNDRFYYEHEDAEVDFEPLFYDEFIYNDSSELQFEVNFLHDENKLKFGIDSDQVLLFSINYELESCLDVVDRIIEDFGIPVELRNEMYLQLKKRIILVKRDHKYGKIERENIEKNRLTPDHNIEWIKSLRNPNNNILFGLNRVFSIYPGATVNKQTLNSGEAFYYINCDKSEDYCSDQNIIFKIVDVILSSDGKSTILKILFQHKDQQAVIITTLEEYNACFIANLLIEGGHICETYKKRLITSFKILITQVKKYNFSIMSKLIKVSYGEVLIKSEEASPTKKNKFNLTKVVLPPEPISRKSTADMVIESIKLLNKMSCSIDEEKDLNKSEKVVKVEKPKTLNIENSSNNSYEIHEGLPKSMEKMKKLNIEIQLSSDECVQRKIGSKIRISPSEIKLGDAKYNNTIVQQIKDINNQKEDHSKIMNINNNNNEQICTFENIDENRSTNTNLTTKMDHHNEYEKPEKNINEVGKDIKFTSNEDVQKTPEKSTDVVKKEVKRNPKLRIRSESTRIGRFDVIRNSPVEETNDPDNFSNEEHLLKETIDSLKQTKFSFKSKTDINEKAITTNCNYDCIANNVTSKNQVLNELTYTDQNIEAHNKCGESLSRLVTNDDGEKRNIQQEDIVAKNIDVQKSIDKGKLCMENNNSLFNLQSNGVSREALLRRQLFAKHDAKNAYSLDTYTALNSMENNNRKPPVSKKDLSKVSEKSRQLAKLLESKEKIENKVNSTIVGTTNHSYHSNVENSDNLLNSNYNVNTDNKTKGHFTVIQIDKNEKLINEEEKKTGLPKF
uniref:Protein kinase domain-containing protein n=1 Tax=Parastrongyloides trichosuri TaxID=131310 RepID=A0A0N4Z3A2_PARTI